MDGGFSGTSWVWGWFGDAWKPLNVMVHGCIYLILVADEVEWNVLVWEAHTRKEWWFLVRLMVQVECRGVVRTKVVALREVYAGAAHG